MDFIFFTKTQECNVFWYVTLHVKRSFVYKKNQRSTIDVFAFSIDHMVTALTKCYPHYPEQQL